MDWLGKCAPARAARFCITCIDNLRIPLAISLLLLVIFSKKSLPSPGFLLHTYGLCLRELRESGICALPARSPREHPAPDRAILHSMHDPAPCKGAMSVASVPTTSHDPVRVKPTPCASINRYDALRGRPLYLHHPYRHATHTGLMVLHNDDKAGASCTTMTDCSLRSQ